MTATQTRKGFKHHVHPEVYSTSDPIEYRKAALHTDRGICEMTFCTFNDLTAKAEAENLAITRSLKNELRKAERDGVEIEPETAKARRGRREITDADRIAKAAKYDDELAAKRSARKAKVDELIAAELATLDVDAAVTKARKSRPASERRNETTHVDGQAAVDHAGCPTCKAKKGAKCIRHDGERTNHVHAARMRKYDERSAK